MYMNFDGVSMTELFIIASHAAMRGILWAIAVETTRSKALEQYLRKANNFHNERTLTKKLSCPPCSAHNAVTTFGLFSLFLPINSTVVKLISAARGNWAAHVIYYLPFSTAYDGSILCRNELTINRTFDTTKAEIFKMMDIVLTSYLYNKLVANEVYLVVRPLSMAEQSCPIFKH